MIILYLFYALIGLSLIIFIHELGHFLAAKWVGARVEAFSVGFDSLFGRKLRLCAFKRGGTEYIIGLIPFGGYVKLAGETSMEAEPRTGPPPSDWLIAKTPGQRAVVFAAGAVFNIISAFLFFALAFTLGVNFMSAQIGGIEAGGPAWKAGLRSGDRIVEINGKPVEEFTEVLVSVAFGSREEPLQVTALRDGQRVGPFPVAPRWNPTQGMRDIGIRNAIDSAVSRVEPGSAIAAAGIEAGDRITGARLGGVEMLDPPTFDLLRDALGTYASLHPGKPFALRIERGGRAEWKTIEPRRDEEAGGIPLLGVSFILKANPFVEAIHPASSAAGRLKPGDRVLRVNGRPALGIEWFTLGLSSADPAAELALEIEDREGAIRELSVSRADAVVWSTREEILWGDFSIRLNAVEDDSPLARAGFRGGDVIARIGTETIQSADDLTAAAKREQPETVEVRVLREGANGKRRQPAIAAPRSLLEEISRASRREPPPAIPVADFPAAEAGMELGARNLAIDGKAIHGREDVTAAVKTAGDRELEVSWVSPSGERKSARIKPRTAAFEDLGWGFQPSQVLVRTGVIDSVGMGMKRTVIVGEWVFLTLKGLILRDVAAKNLSGPVGIFYIIVRVSEYGFGTLIYWLALISVNLGILNLLPIPILDGGHLLFLLIEKIKGSPVDIRIQEIATTVAFFLIIGLAIFVTYNDIARLVGF